jgi:hypothetical protein
MTFIYNIALKGKEKRLSLCEKGGNLGKIFSYHERY